MIRFTPLALAAAMLASSLAPIAAVAATDNVVRVSYRDLDLATSDGQSTLTRRLRNAANRLCHTDQTRGIALHAACREEVLAEVVRPIQLAMKQDAVRLAGVASATAVALR